MRNERKDLAPLVDLPVEMELSRCSGGDHETPWRLVIVDARSRTRIAEVRFGHEAFADLMSSRHGAGAVATVGRSSHLGLVHENMTAHVSVTRGRSPEAIARMAEEANPGWTADVEKTFNGHRFKDGKYAVTMRRWVEPT